MALSEASLGAGCGSSSSTPDAAGWNAEAVPSDGTSEALAVDGSSCPTEVLAEDAAEADRSEPPPASRMSMVEDESEPPPSSLEQRPSAAARCPVSLAGVPRWC